MNHRPKILWFKARLPGAVSDGSSVVSMNLAQCLAEVFDIDLISVRLGRDEDRLAAGLVPPFRSVTLVTPNSRWSAIHRAVYCIGNTLRARLSQIPLGALHDDCSGVRQALIDLSKRNQYDLAHFEYWTSSRLLRLPLGCPKVIYLHDATFRTVEQMADVQPDRKRSARLRRRADELRLFELQSAAGAERAHFLSTSDLRLLGGAGATDAGVIPMLMPQPPRTGACDKPHVLFIGRFEHAPNVEAAIWLAESVVPIVSKSLPGAVFRIAGPGMSRQVSVRIQRPGIQLLGWVGQLSQLYADAAVAVAPLHAGTGVNVKVLEAMWHGVPVVTTSLGARATPAADGGAVIADDAESFARAVIELLSDAKRRESLRQDAWRLMDRDHCGDEVRRDIQRQFLKLAGCASADESLAVAGELR